jgi:hypothetical protein
METRGAILLHRPLLLRSPVLVHIISLTWNGRTSIVVPTGERFALVYNMQNKHATKRIRIVCMKEIPRYLARNSLLQESCGGCHHEQSRYTHLTIVTIYNM